jgi:ABC-type bacteriocin/lantibiotic exporter with double-glycine peptidase domain
MINKSKLRIHFEQEYQNDCAIACLKIHFAKFDIDFNLNELGEYIKVEKNGVKLNELISFLEHKNINHTIYELENENSHPDNFELISTPAILFSKNINHYTYIHDYVNGNINKCYISDPIYKNVITQEVNDVLNNAMYIICLKR